MGKHAVKTASFALFVLNIGLVALPVQARAASEAVLYAFQGTLQDGQRPNSDLVKVGGTFYGTAAGTRNCAKFLPCGVVFELRPGSPAKVIHSFRRSGGFGTDSGLLDVAGTLYGTTNYGGTGTCENPYPGCGTIYAITPPKGFADVLDFTVAMGQPVGGLISDGTTLYGVTTADNIQSEGMVYAITPSGTLTPIHQFQDGNGDGYSPLAPPTVLNGTLYGTTAEGGAYGYGTVYSIAPDGTETILHSFQGTGDGVNPIGKLLSLNGNLYGTTPGLCSGAAGCGTIFEITPSGAFTVLYAFQGKNDGAYPSADLTEMNGTIYGTTEFYGKDRFGTVFSITPDGTFKTVYSFQGGSDGAQPVAGVIGVAGMLYGTTAYGGPADDGTVFEVTP